MDIYAYLKKDHRLVKELMKQVLATEDRRQHERLFEKINAELGLHADTEEKTFYTELKQKGGRHLQEKEDHAEEEHDEIRHYLHKLGAADIDSPEWLVAFGGLKHAVEHHIEEEEGEIFEKAKKVIPEGRAKALAREMEALKQQKKGKLKQDQADQHILERMTV
jgi:hemerythrin superfamily protein